MFQHRALPTILAQCAILFILLSPVVVFAQGAITSGPQAPQKTDCEDQLAVMSQYAQIVRQRGDLDLLSASELKMQLEKLRTETRRLQDELKKSKEPKIEGAS